MNYKHYIAAQMTLCAVMFAQPPVIIPIPVSAIIPVFMPRYINVTIGKQVGMAQSLTGLNLDGYVATICSKDGKEATIGGGLVWQAAENGGLQPVMPLVSSIAATQKRARSGWEIGLAIGADVMYGLALAGGSNIVVVNPAKIIGKLWRLAPVIAGHQIASIANERNSIQPDPVAIFSRQYLDPAELLQIPAGNGVCVQKVFLSTAGGVMNVKATVEIAQ